MDEIVRSDSPATRTLPASLRHLSPVLVDDLIRLGGKSDGGYVVPRSAVLAADVLISFGLGHDWSFEEALKKLKPGVQVHVYDHTVSEGTFFQHMVSIWKGFANGLDSIVTPAVTLNLMKIVLDCYERYRDFFRGDVVHFREQLLPSSCSGNGVEMNTVFARAEGKQCVLLKMDIEGAEYRLIDDMLAHQDRIGLIVLEFHATNFLRELFLEKIEQICRYFEIVHIHGNNIQGLAHDGLPAVLEMTFLNKSRCSATSRRDSLPIEGLDYPNNPAQADYELVFGSDKT